MAFPCGIHSCCKQQKLLSWQASFPPPATVQRDSKPVLEDPNQSNSGFHLTWRPPLANLIQNWPLIEESNAEKSLPSRVRVVLAVERRQSSAWTRRKSDLQPLP